MTHPADKLPLPEASPTALINGPQGSEYRSLSENYEPHCATISPENTRKAMRTAYDAGRASVLAEGEPVAEVHKNHLLPAENGKHWCREVLLYSGNNPGDFLNGKNTRVKLYTHPAASLTDAQIEQIAQRYNTGRAGGDYEFARAIEAALKGQA